MFSGLVRGKGAVLDASGGRFVVAPPPVAALREVAIGDSVAVSGVCLTAVSVAADALGFDLAEETRRRTTLGGLAAGAEVNLELPLRVSDRLGGHFVQGHVDAVGRVVAAGGEPSDYRIRVEHPEPRWIVEKGSVALDGVSLTVARSEPAERAFEVAVIPYTREVTTLGQVAPGDPVHIEYDILAKYVAAQMSPESVRESPTGIHIMADKKPSESAGET